MKRNFEETVKRMSAYEIVMAMINGLEKKHVEINMATFGDYDGNLCYGCCATNAICEISGVKFIPSTIFTTNSRAKAVDSSESFLYSFELAINNLRRGFLDSYNRRASELGIALMPENTFSKNLPHLSTVYLELDLPAYKAYAKSIKPKTNIFIKLWNKLRNRSNN